MVPRTRDVVERLLQNLHRLDGAGAFGRPARAQVPHLPRRLVHDRLGEDHAYLDIVRIVGEDLAHRARIGLVPRRHVLDRLALWIARWQGMDHPLLDRGRLLGMRQRVLHGVVGRFQRHLPAVRVIEIPGEVVVRARGIADAPVRHGAVRIVLQRPLEALNRLAMVEAEQPVEPAVEPELRIGRRCGDRTAVRSEIEIVHVSPLLFSASPPPQCRRSTAESASFQTIPSSPWGSPLAAAILCDNYPANTISGNEGRHAG